jgi:uncharacterized protein
MFSQQPPSLSPSQIGVRPPAALSATFLTHAFTWMFVGLLLTAGVAAVVQSNQPLLEFAQGGFLILLLGQLGLVVAIGALINRIGATAALGLFLGYAASLGLTIGLIVSAYSGTSVVAAFLSASAMFGGAALYGATTKRPLVGIGGYLSMGLIGLIVAMVINVFLPSGPFGLVVSIIGVVLFTALTAYDVQRIGGGDLAARYGSMEKGAVIGALQLYLDFINLFLFLLRLTGGRR